MKTPKKITIYSKFCFNCVEREAYSIIKSWAIKNKVQMKVVRTALDPISHWSASKYRGENYLSFVAIGKKSYGIGEFISKFVNPPAEELEL